VPAVAPVRVAASVRTSLIAWSGSRSRTDELTKAGLFTIGKLAIPVGIVIEASGVVSGIVMSNGTEPVRNGGGLSSSPMMRSDAAWVPTVMANTSAAAPATTTLNVHLKGPEKALFKPFGFARQAIPWSRGPDWVGRVAVCDAARPPARAGGSTRRSLGSGTSA